MTDEPIPDTVPRAELERAVAAERRKRRWVQLALAAAVALLVAGAVGSAWRRDWRAGMLAIAEAERMRAEYSQRDQERAARNAAAVVALLDRCEDALRAGDVDRAALALEAAEKRFVEGGAEQNKDRLDRSRADLKALRELDQLRFDQWARQLGGSNGPDHVAPPPREVTRP